MKNLSKTLCAVTLIIAVACTKEGTPGPKGTPGTVGPRDTSTIIVVTPPPPTTTTPTVLYSDWMSPAAALPGNPSSGTGTAGNGSTGNGTTSSINHFMYFNVTAPAITQSILDNGVILAYCKLANDNNNTRALTTTTFSSGFIQIWDFVLSVGKVQFTQYSSNPLGITSMDRNNKFRYVIIPSTKHVRTSKPYNQMTYDEICELFSIPK